MDFVSLQLQNFGPIEDTFLNLSAKGLVNIEGQNLDDPSANSNGSGKSTIADGLSWVAYGETARGVSGDEVIRDSVGKDCYGALTVLDGDDRYLIERWRKKKGFKGKLSGLALSRATADGELIDLSDGTDKMTQAKIETVLGCSHDVFTKAIYSGQEALPDLPKMTDKQIKELVEEAAGIEILADAYVIARDHLRTRTNEQSAVLSSMQAAETKVADLRAEVERLTASSASWDEGQKVKIATKQTELDGVAASARTLAAEVSATNVAPLEAEVETLRAKVSAVEGERLKERELSDAATAAARKATQSKTAFDNQMTAVRRAKNAFDGVEAKVGTPCDECGKPHTADDVADVKKLAAAKLRTETEAAQTLRAQAQIDAEAEKSAVEAVSAFQATMTDLTATTRRLEELRVAINVAGMVRSNFENERAKIVRVRGERTALEAETNPFADMIAGAEARVETAMEAVRVASAELKVAEKNLKVAECAVRVFGPAGVRAFVLDTVTPYLNERTSHYLGTLSDGRIEAVWTTLTKGASGDLKEKFSIEVEKTGGGRSFRALSGGEKRKVRLACALALQDLVASRATKPISLWIGDEIDDALDEAGLERLMIVLEEKAREKGTVLVISHNSLRDWIRETVTVTMEDGRSTVSGSLS